MKAKKIKAEPHVLYSTFSGRECCISPATGKMFFRNRRKPTLTLPTPKEK